MTVHLPALIVGHRFEQDARLAVEYVGEAFHDLLGGRIVELDEGNLLARPFDQRAH